MEGYFDDCGSGPFGGYSHGQSDFSGISQNFPVTTFQIQYYVSSKFIQFPTLLCDCYPTAKAAGLFLEGTKNQVIFII